MVGSPPRLSQTVDSTARNVLVEQERPNAVMRAAASLAVRVQWNWSSSKLASASSVRGPQCTGPRRVGLLASDVHPRRSRQRGTAVPTSVTAGAKVSLVGFNLRELRRVRALKQERWLACCCRWTIRPSPSRNEPPIRFPDSAYIKQVTKLRFGASGSQFDNWKDFSNYRINVKR